MLKIVQEITNFLVWCLVPNQSAAIRAVLLRFDRPVQLCVSIEWQENWNFGMNEFVDR